MNLRRSTPNNLNAPVPDPDVSGLLASSFPAFIRGLLPTQNAYIMRTKCAQKRECHIINTCATTPYDFNAVKWTHFKAPVPGPALNLNLSLNPNPGVPLLLCLSAVNQRSSPKLTETDRFRPILPEGYYTNKCSFSRHRTVSLRGPIPSLRLRAFATLR
jgi:hypothetical protein